MSDKGVGLVLSGGGAKGAYQVGVLKALLELGGRVDAIAGASIGALNGAILAAAPSLPEGVARLEEAWLTLAHSPPLVPNQPRYFELLAAAGLRLNGLDGLTQFALTVRSLGGSRVAAIVDPWIAVADLLSSGLYSDTPIRRLLDQYMDTVALARGLPLYVSVLESDDPVRDVWQVLLAEVGLGDSRDSEFLHIQSLSPEARCEAILASAALPIFFAAKEVGGKRYSDGGQGGWSKAQGNTPIAPLLSAGYRTIIVSHLSDGSLWSRRDFPDATVLEIRPQSPIARMGGLSDMLGFDDTIPSWIEQGYVDAMHTLGEVKRAVSTWARLRATEHELEAMESQCDDADRRLSHAMARLHSPKGSE